jgi:integrase
MTPFSGRGPRRTKPNDPQVLARAPHTNRLVSDAQVTTVHVLRHTFCSHLAMKGAPARAIQELAGHQDLSTTQRYMHLSPAAIEGAIRLLEQPTPVWGRGEIMETADRETAKTSG